jgi:hypothetical protein
VFGKKMQRRLLELKTEEVTGGQRILHERFFRGCTLHQTLIHSLNQEGGMYRARSTYERKEIYTKF